MAPFEVNFQTKKAIPNKRDGLDCKHQSYLILLTEHH